MDILKQISDIRKNHQAFSGEPTETVFVYLGLLGKNLVKEPGFAGEAVKLLAAFTDQPEKEALLEVFPFDKMDNLIPRLSAKTAILCVPHRQAAPLAAKLRECGIEHILNWSGVELPAADGVEILTEEPPCA